MVKYVNKYKVTSKLTLGQGRLLNYLSKLTAFMFRELTFNGQSITVLLKMCFWKLLKNFKKPKKDRKVHCLKVCNKKLGDNLNINSL